MAASTKPRSTRKTRSSSPSSTRPEERARPWSRDYVKTRKRHGTGSRGDKVIRWIEANCVHTNDRWLGKPFRLLVWQKWVILALFTVGVDGLRVVRWALIGIAKKNGKTELCAALGLFFAFG